MRNTRIVDYLVIREYKEIILNITPKYSSMKSLRYHCKYKKQAFIFNERSGGMKKLIKYLGSFILVILISVCFLYLNNDIGISRSNIEKDARYSHKIKDTWDVAKDTTESMSAMIFYSEDFSDHTFSIYVNRPGLSFGYFFRGGGSVIETERYIAEIYIEGYNERAFVSMNRQQVSKVEIDDGNEVQTIEIDSEKPFVFILPNNVGSLTIYDINGNIVESVQHKI